MRSLFSSAIIASTTLAVCNAAPKAPVQLSSLTGRNDADACRLTWGTCHGTTNDTMVAKLGLQCATLEVPLDYQNQSDGRKLVLDLVKYPAQQPKSKGSILYNPGGPGESGRGSFLNTVSNLGFAGIPGMSDYDWVTWDPRGLTSDSILVNCYDNSTEAQLAATQVPVPFNTSIEALTASWEANQKIWTVCQNKLGENGTLIGTVYNARDMLAIVDALGEDGLLHYYGLSYGTVLGQVFSRMFPDRVGKVVIDGVVNLKDWLSGTYVQSPASIDATLSGFISTCETRPEICNLTLVDTSQKSLEQQVKNLFVSLATGADTSFNPPLEWSAVVPSIYSGLKLPDFVTTSRLLYSVLTKNQTGYNEVQKFLEQEATSGSSASFNSISINEFPEIGNAIRCSDSVNRIISPADDTEHVAALINQSYWGGPLLAGQTQIACANWPFKAKEQYTGSLGRIKTKNPLLLLSNIYDPITPLVSARDAHLLFEGSILLAQNGFGHTTSAEPSACTLQHVRRYFISGVLPPPDTICETDLPPFFNSTELGDGIVEQVKGTTGTTG